MTLKTRNVRWYIFWVQDIWISLAAFKTWFKEVTIFLIFPFFYLGDWSVLCIFLCVSGAPMFPLFCISILRLHLTEPVASSRCIYCNGHRISWWVYAESPPVSFRHFNSFNIPTNIRIGMVYCFLVTTIDTLFFHWKRNPILAASFKKKLSLFLNDENWIKNDMPAFSCVFWSNSVPLVWKRSCLINIARENHHAPK